MSRVTLIACLVALMCACGRSKEPAKAEGSALPAATASGNDSGPLKVYDEVPSWPTGQEQAMLARFEIRGVSRLSSKDGKSDEVVSVYNGTDIYVVAAEVRYEISRRGVVVTKAVHCKHERGIPPGETGNMSCGMPSMNSLTDELAGNFSTATLYAVIERGGVLYAKPIRKGS